ncbi:MAG: hypothetical protein WBM90_05420 [Acidimicrobiia bacterium]
MTGRVVLLMASSLVLAACTSNVAEPVATEPGRLVVIDGSGDVVIVDPDGANQLALTEDGGDGAVYSQPIWSPDGQRIAWGQLSDDGFAVAIGEVEETRVSEVAVTGLPFYLYWSSSGENIGVLHNGSSGLDFELVDVANGTAEVVGRGSPFYFSWNPSEEQLVTHVGQRTFDLIEAGGDKSNLGTTDPGYLAPQWTNAGIFHVAGEGLVIENDGNRQVIADVGEFTTFVANGQGTHVALQTTRGAPAISVGLVDVEVAPVNVVVVVDVKSGETQVVSSEPSVGYFWSPDGESLLIFAATGGGVQPSVWTDGEELVDHVPFRPSLTLVRDLLPFFPQYAQSMSFWAADSSAFAYPTDDGVWVQTLDAEQPTRVSDGIWVAWSG